MNIFRTFPVAIGLGTLAVLTACGVAPHPLVSRQKRPIVKVALFLGNQPQPARTRRIKCTNARSLFRAVHI